MHSNFWKMVARNPPIVCRLLARHRYGAPLTTLELAEKLGWTPAKVDAFSYSTSWQRIDILDLKAWMEACGVDPCNSKQIDRNDAYMRGRMIDGHRQAPRFTYLKKASNWADYYLPLIKTWTDHLAKSMGVARG